MSKVILVSQRVAFLTSFGSEKRLWFASLSHSGRLKIRFVFRELLRVRHGRSNFGSIADWGLLELYRVRLLWLLWFLCLIAAEQRLHSLVASLWFVRSRLGFMRKRRSKSSLVECCEDSNELRLVESAIIEKYVLKAGLHWQARVITRRDADWAQ